MKFLIFQKLTYNHIFFIVYLIFSVPQAVLETYTNKKQKKINKDNGGHFYQIIILIVTFLSDFLLIIPYFIKKCLANNKTKTMTDEVKSPLKNNEDFIYNNINDEEIRKKSKKLKFLIFLVGLTDFLGEIVYILSYIYFEDNNSSNLYSLFSSDVVFQIVIQYILSAIILKTYFYKHHYLSIIINVISLIILSTLDIINNYYYLLKALLYYISLVFFDIENTYGKKAMIYGFLSPFNLLIFRGVYKLIFLIIFLAIFIPTIISIDNNFLGDLNVFYRNDILIAFLYFIF